MEQYAWDGPEDSDEEVPEMVLLKNQHEKQMGIKFSKRGIIEFIENFLATEDPAKNSAWSQKSSADNFKFSMKEDGSSISKD